MIRWMMLVAGVGLLMLAGLLSGAATNGPVDAVAYVHTRQHCAHVYLASTDGDDDHALLEHCSSFYSPVYTLDATSDHQVVVRIGSSMSSSDWEEQTYRINQALGDPVTVNLHSGQAPYWSPDRQQVAYTYFSGDLYGSLPAQNLTVLDIASDTPTTLIPLGKLDGFLDTALSWSPDGAWIAFTGGANDWPSLHKVRVADGEVERLTDDSTYDYYPQWSPDGQWISFQASVDDLHTLERVATDGTQRQTIATDVRVAEVVWSPDSQWVAFNGGILREQGIYVARADGSHLLAWPYPDVPCRYSPQWSPDGRWLLCIDWDRRPTPPIWRLTILDPFTGASHPVSGFNRNADGSVFNNHPAAWVQLPVRTWHGGWLAGAGGVLLLAFAISRRWQP